MTHEEKANDLLKQQYHCSQALLGAFAEDFGMDYKTVFRISTCFGGGMRKGGTCGCITAAMMVLGLAFGFYDSRDRDLEMFGNKRTEEFIDRFTEGMCNDVYCRDILEHDISTADGIATIRKEGLILKKCPRAMHVSIEILEDMLEKYADDVQYNYRKAVAIDNAEETRSLLKKADKVHRFETNIINLLEKSDKQIGFIQFDISRFKIINDIYGERMGDQILYFIKESLIKICRDDQYFLNLRSDVFMVVTEFESESELNELIHTIQTVCKSYKNIKLSYSIGVYIVEDRTMDLRQLEDRAAMARKKAKGNVINNVLYYQEEFKEMLYLRKFIEESIPSAIEERQFQMYLQPKYSIVRNHIIGAEALVRWKHPERGMIFPNEFIPVIEENGYVKKVDYYIWKEAAGFLKRCEDAGLHNCPISVNVSRLHLKDTAFIKYLAETIENAGIPKKQLELEITETVNDAQISTMAEMLKNQGYKLLMDDFGSGYSSLNILLETPFDVIKLDKKFIEHMIVSKKGRLILEHVVAMANKLGLELLAEGVETEEQVRLLQSIGCDNVQGYYYAKPMPAEEFFALLQQDRASLEE